MQEGRRENSVRGQVMGSGIRTEECRHWAMGWSRPGPVTHTAGDVTSSIFSESRPGRQSHRKHVCYTSPPPCFSRGPDLLWFAADLLGMEGGKLGALRLSGVQDTLSA